LGIDPSSSSQGILRVAVLELGQVVAAGPMTALPAVGFDRTSLGMTAPSARDRYPLLEPQKSK
jgi:hypothetical protein